MIRRRPTVWMISTGLLAAIATIHALATGASFVPAAIWGFAFLSACLSPWIVRAVLRPYMLADVRARVLARQRRDESKVAFNALVLLSHQRARTRVLTNSSRN